MEQAFEMQVKIVENGKNVQVDTRLEGSGDVRPETLVNVLSELVPVVLKEDREAVLKLCRKLALGMRPEKNNHESISIDLPHIKQPEE